MIVLHSETYSDVNGDFWETSYSLDRSGGKTLLRKTVEGITVTQCSDEERRELEEFGNQEASVGNGFELAAEFSALLSIDAGSLSDLNTDEVCRAIAQVAPPWEADFRLACEE